MGSRGHWVKLDVAQFCLEVSAAKTDSELAEWTRTLAKSLAYGDGTINEFGAFLLKEAENFKEAKSSAAKKRWSSKEAEPMQTDAVHTFAYANECTAMQNDALHTFAYAKRCNAMQNDANTSFDVMYCSSSSSSSLKDLEKEKESERRDTREEQDKPHRESRENEQPASFADRSLGDSGDGGDSGSMDRAQDKAITAQPANSVLESFILIDPTLDITGGKKPPRTRATSGRNAQYSGKTPLEVEHPEAWALWCAAPKIARQRSSTMEVMAAWAKAKKYGVPPVDQLLASLECWKLSKKWAENGGEYIEGLHRWINNRQWENAPASAMQIAVEQAEEVDRRIVDVFAQC